MIIVEMGNSLEADRCNPLVIVSPVNSNPCIVVMHNSDECADGKIARAHMRAGRQTKQ